MVAGQAISSRQIGLLVDDDVLYLRTLQRSLEKRGFRIVIAESLSAAMAAAQQHRPDFTLLDLRIGAESGLGLIGPLKALRADMRVLLVTGYATAGTAEEACKRGADDYLAKPLSIDALVRAIEE